MCSFPPYLERGDVGSDVDGVPARVGGVDRRSLGDGHGQQVGALVLVVLLGVVRLNAVQELLRGRQSRAAEVHKVRGSALSVMVFGDRCATPPLHPHRYYQYKISQQRISEERSSQRRKNRQIWLTVFWRSDFGRGVFGRSRVRVLCTRPPYASGLKRRCTCHC